MEVEWKLFVGGKSTMRLHNTDVHWSNFNIYSGPDKTQSVDVGQLMSTHLWISLMKWILNTPSTLDCKLSKW